MNQNTPFGFLPYNAPGAGVFGRLGSYEIPSGHAQNLLTGDLVALTGTGRRIALGTAGAGNNLLGSVQGVRYVNTQGDVKFAPVWLSGMVAVGLTVGTDPEALVYDDPMQEFIAQVSGDGLAAGAVVAQSPLLIAAGSLATGISAHQVNGGTQGTNNQLRIIGLAPIPGNSYGQYAKAIVQIRQHQLGGAYAGIAA